MIVGGGLESGCHYHSYWQMSLGGRNILRTIGKPEKRENTHIQCAAIIISLESYNKDGLIVIRLTYLATNCTGDSFQQQLQFVKENVN